MKILNRTSFVIEPATTLGQVFDDVASSCFRWVFNPTKGLSTPPGWNTSIASTIEKTCLADGTYVESVMLEDSINRIHAWGLRYSHPDRDDSTIQWTCELGLLSKSESKPWFSCTLGVSRLGATLSPVRRGTTRPKIVTDILSRFRCMGTYRLEAAPIKMNPTLNDAEKFMDVLTDERRTHPIIFISASNTTDSPLISPYAVASNVAGLAHVVTGVTSNVPDLLRGKMPAMLRAYNGAIRLYWPGFRVGDHHYNHPLWTAEKIQSYTNPTPRMAQKLLGIISASAVFNLHENVLTWDSLQSLVRAKAIEEAKAQGKNDELLLLFEDENRILNNEVKSLKNAISQQADELKKQRNLAEMFRASLDERKQVGEQELALPPAETVDVALEHTQARHGKKIVFAFNSKSEHFHCPFEAPEEVEKAFEWLATVYWKAKCGEESCPDLDKSIHETIPAWSYSGGQKKHSVAKYQEDYQCNFDGEEYWIGEHIGTGTSKDARETIRIAFAWDHRRKMIIVGFIGQHQRTSAT